MFDRDVEDLVRVVNLSTTSPKWGLFFCQQPIQTSDDPKGLEGLAIVLRAAFNRRLLGAYYRFSVELRDRLRWPTGVGAEQTMQEIVQMRRDLTAAQEAILELQQTIEVRESELESVKGQFRIQYHELQLARQELLTARDSIRQLSKQLRSIADSSSDKASRVVAEGILCQEGQ